MTQKFSFPEIGWVWQFLLVLWISLSCPSCIYVTFTKKYGDAKYLDRKEILTWGVMSDEIRWPKMSFGQRGVYQFEVRKMSRAIFPNRLYLELPGGNHNDFTDSVPATWEKCRVRLVYKSVAGEVFYNETLILGDREKVIPRKNYEGSSITFQILPTVTPQLSDLRDYNIKIEILDPVEQSEKTKGNFRSSRILLKNPRAYLFRRGRI